MGAIKLPHCPTCSDLTSRAAAPRSHFCTLRHFVPRRLPSCLGSPLASRRTDVEILRSVRDLLRQAGFRRSPPSSPSVMRTLSLRSSGCWRPNVLLTPLRRGRRPGSLLGAQVCLMRSSLKVRSERRESRRGEPQVWRGNRTELGASTQARMMTFFRTAGQQGVDPIGLLVRLVQSTRPVRARRTRPRPHLTARARADRRPAIEPRKSPRPNSR